MPCTLQCTCIFIVFVLPLGKLPSCWRCVCGYGRGSGHTTLDSPLHSCYCFWEIRSVSDWNENRKWISLECISDAMPMPMQYMQQHHTPTDNAFERKHISVAATSSCQCVTPVSHILCELLCTPLHRVHRHSLRLTRICILSSFCDCTKWRNTRHTSDKDGGGKRENGGKSIDKLSIKSWHYMDFWST